MTQVEPNAQPAAQYQVVVIGSGAAGLFTALEAAKSGSVLVVTKGAVADCNTNWAQGGIAVAVGPADSTESHLRDTIAAGAGLVDKAAARVLCEEGPARLADLIEYGVRFDMSDGHVGLGREAAHSEARIVHSGGDRTGAGIEFGLIESVRERGIAVAEETRVRRLLKDGGRVVGVELDGAGGRRSVAAGSVVIASGGAGQLFSHTTNPEVATGDGLAIAFGAGADVADLEFYQFHPTALRMPGVRPFLISEAIRGEGAIIRNGSGDAFMSRYSPMKELAPRDVVARAIVTEMRRTQTDAVFLDCTGIRHVDVNERFPGISAFCREQGLDIAHEPIPIAPAAHYFMGGIRTDTDGRTTVPGLYACGEAACTGVHGANRLASNSLLETVVFAKRVAEQIARGEGDALAPAGDAMAPETWFGTAPDAATLQQLMWDSCGIERSRDGLAEAISSMAAWPVDPPGDGADSARLSGMSLIARLMIEAALRRTESRGAHYRTDFRERDDARWARRQVFRRGA